MSAFLRRSLSHQFLIASFPILLIGLLLIGSWMATQIEQSVAYRIGGVTGMYVDSFIAPHVQSLVANDELSADDQFELDRIITTPPLSDRIVSLKIWNRDGRVLYSNTKALIGRKFPVGEGLRVALSGDVHSERSDLTDHENEYERQNWSHLIETYAPLLASGAGTVIAAAEFYHPVEDLARASRAAQLQSWLLMAAIVAGMYLLLFAMVRRGSKTIDEQQEDLNNKVVQLTSLITQNNQLHERVRRAAGRTAALNEVFLRRISADLHDGPGQDMGLALMQFESIGDRCMVCANKVHEPLSSVEEFQTIRTAMRSALADLRAISAGLQLPEMDIMSPCEIAARAIRDYAGKTGATVTLDSKSGTAPVSLSVKITLYRLLQESLANGFRHAGGSGQHIEVRAQDDRLQVRVSDRGAGFDPGAAAPEGHMGLAGMRERIEILGGSIDLQSRPGEGTSIRVVLPLVVPGLEEDQGRQGSQV